MKTTGFVKCGPNEVLVVSGGCHARPLLVHAGRIFVMPFLQKVQRVSLNTMSFEVRCPNVYARQAVPISVTSVAVIKIEGQKKDKLRTACELFAGKRVREISDIARTMLEGHQAAAVGSMLVEDVNGNWEAFAQKVLRIASRDLNAMGFTVVSFVVNEVSDANGYIEALRLTKQAQLKRDIRIEDAEARRDSLVNEAIAQQEHVEAKNAINAEIAKMSRDFEMAKCDMESEISEAKAEADFAFPLQTAATLREVKEAEMEVAIAEASLRLAAQEEAARAASASLQESVQTLTYEQHALQRECEAAYNKVIAEAEAEAQAISLMGEAAAFAIEARAFAEVAELSVATTALVVRSAGNNYCEECAVSTTNGDEKLHNVEVGQETSGDKVNCDMRGAADCELEREESCEDEAADDVPPLKAETVAEMPSEPAAMLSNDGNNNKGCDCDEFEDGLDEGMGQDLDEILQTLSKVHLKMCEITGLNLTNAILSAVFQEVLELFK